MSDDRAAQSSKRWKHWGVWSLQLVAALAFGASGASKLAGAPAMVEVFSAIGIGQWFRYLTGLLELVGAVLLLVPKLAFLGGGLLTCIMAGAVFTHLVVIGGSPLPALVLLVVSVTVAYQRWPTAKA